MKNVPIETARGQSGKSGVHVHAPVVLVSNSAFAASLPPELTEPGVRASSMAMWRTVSVTSVHAVVRSHYSISLLYCVVFDANCIFRNSKCFLIAMSCKRLSFYGHVIALNLIEWR